VTSSKPMRQLLGRLWFHISARRRHQFGLLLILMVFASFAEILSIGAVLPFLGALTDPGRLFGQSAAQPFIRALNLSSPDQLLLPVTIAFSLASVVAGSTRLLLLWASTRLSFATGADLSNNIYQRTLYQPYHVHIGRNSSTVISGINNKVAVSVNVLSQVLALLSSVALLTAITLALVVIDPTVALIAALAFGSSYLVISWMSRRQLRRNSQRIAEAQTQVVKALQEGLGGIRDVLIDGTQAVYCEVYNQSSQQLRRALGNNVFIGGSPRFVMESLGMVLIAALAFGVSSQPGGVATALPVLGALALGAQRLLPTLQQIFNAWATITGSHASLDNTIDLLDQPFSMAQTWPPVERLDFKEEIRFDNARFRYTPIGPWVIDGLSLVIPRGSRVGIVGSTGSGKSTALDILMGLLSATEGGLLIDGKPLNGDDKIKAWQKVIAHVPQSIFLADSTLAENIALGVPAANIDFEKVKRVSRQAHVADFIENGLAGYNAFVGERGVRLSGGQRQRIGIARALYKEADVLVFDEATSALDNATEQSVMEAIEGLDRSLTIIMIAHRLSTVRHCDVVFELERGRVVAQGTFNELIERSASFRQLAAMGA
jgi:ABC-type multidrug transport system fused ATPase/permease subunit